MPLILIENDKERKLVEKAGRYSCEAEILKSPEHALAAINAAKKLFLEGISKVLGYEFYPNGYSGDGFRYEGPLDHLNFSADVSDDLGPVVMPEPPAPIGGEISDDRLRNWQERIYHWQEAERKRAARKVDAESELVDFRLHAKFLTPGLPYFREAGKTDQTIAGGKTGILVPKVFN